MESTEDSEKAAEIRNERVRVLKQVLAGWEKLDICNPAIAHILMTSQSIESFEKVTFLQRTNESGSNRASSTSPLLITTEKTSTEIGDKIYFRFLSLNSREPLDMLGDWSILEDSELDSIDSTKHSNEIDKELMVPIDLPKPDLSQFSVPSETAEEKTTDAISVGKEPVSEKNPQVAERSEPSKPNRFEFSAPMPLNIVKQKLDEGGIEAKENDDEESDFTDDDSIDGSEESETKEKSEEQGENGEGNNGNDDGEESEDYEESEESEKEETPSVVTPPPKQPQFEKQQWTDKKQKSSDQNPKVKSCVCYYCTTGYCATDPNSINWTLEDAFKVAGDIWWATTGAEKLRRVLREELSRNAVILFRALEAEEKAKADRNLKEDLGGILTPDPENDSDEVKTVPCTSELFENSQSPTANEAPKINVNGNSLIKMINGIPNQEITLKTENQMKENTEKPSSTITTADVDISKDFVFRNKPSKLEVVDSSQPNTFEMKEIIRVKPSSSATLPKTSLQCKTSVSSLVKNDINHKESQQNVGGNKQVNTNTPLNMKEPPGRGNAQTATKLPKPSNKNQKKCQKKKQLTKKQKRGKTTPKVETEDQMLERLIEENKNSDQNRIENDFVNALLGAISDNQNANKSEASEVASQKEKVQQEEKKEEKDSEKEEKKEATQTKMEVGTNILLERRIAEIELEELMRTFLSEVSYGDMVIETIKSGILCFSQDILNVLEHGMHPDNVGNRHYELFKEFVVLPVPEPTKVSADRLDTVFDFMWHMMKVYMEDDEKYQKLRCIVYLYLLDFVKRHYVLFIPTVEKLMNYALDPNEDFEAREEEFLKLILAEYDETKGFKNRDLES